MAKSKTLCTFCESAKIEVGESFCGRCERPTEWATYDDRVRWELAQWRDHREADEAASQEHAERGLRSIFRAIRRARRSEEASASTTIVIDSSASTATAHRPAPSKRPASAKRPASPKRPASLRPAPAPVLGPDPSVQESVSPIQRNGRDDRERIAATLQKMASYAGVGSPQEIDLTAVQQRDPRAEVDRARADLRRAQTRLDQLEERLEHERGRDA